MTSVNKTWTTSTNVKDTTMIERFFSLERARFTTEKSGERKEMARGGVGGGDAPLYKLYEF